MLITMLLEAISLGLIFPIISIFSNESVMSFDFNIFDFDFGNFLLSISKFNFLILLIVIFSFKLVFLIFSSFFQSYFTFKAMSYISKKLFTNYIYQNYFYLTNSNTSLLIRNIVNESNQFAKGIVQPILIFLSEGFILFGVLILLVVVDINSVLIISLFFLIFIFIFSFFTKTKISLYGKQKQIFVGEMIKTINQTFQSISYIKSSFTEKIFEKIHKKNLSKVTMAAMYQQFYNKLPKIWLEYVAVISVLLLILITYRNEDSSIFIAKIAVFAIAGIKILPSINKIITSAQTMNYSMPSLKLINKDLDLKIPNFKFDYSFNGLRFLELKNIFFSYNNEKTFDFNGFSVSENEYIYLSGLSGSGKTTFINILSGLLRPDKGIFKINDKEYTNEMYPPTNNFIGYVPQSTILLDENLIFNTTFKKNLSLNETKYLEGLFEIFKLNELKEKYFDKNLNIGERGIKISGGQIQRIGMIRALFNKPDILILDEATSGIDVDLERDIIKKIKENNLTKSIIFISHRKRNLELFDTHYEISNLKLKKIN
jgi:ABC-type multidrug transport system fused ATPase/permease subunit